MKKPWAIVLALGAMVLVFVCWPSPKEPSYQGKRLSQWLFQNYYPRDANAYAEANNAIRQIGTNALPALLEWIQYQPGPWRMRMDAVRLQLAPQIKNSRSVAGAFRDWNEFKASSTSEAFRLLGDGAASAVPELTSIAKNAPSWEVSIRAMQSLSGIGETGLPGLVSIAVDTNVESRRRVSAITQFAQSAELGLRVAALAQPKDPNVAVMTALVLKCLVPCTEDKDPNVAATATHSLGVLRRAPEVAVPVIAKAYQNPHASVRIRAVSALSEFGSDAAGLTNVLAQALSDPDSRIQDAARVALERVKGREISKPNPE